MCISRMRYQKSLREYQEQIDYYEMASDYINIGTLFDGEKFNLSRNFLLNFLEERSCKLKELLSKENDGKKALTEKQRGRLEVSCKKMDILFLKIKKGMKIKNEDISGTYIGLSELLLYRIL